jgi:hypothetical protein
VFKENFCKKNQISKFPVFPLFFPFFPFSRFFSISRFSRTDASKVRSFVRHTPLIIIRNFLELKKVGSGCGCISLAVLIFSAVISDYPYFWVYG